MLDHAPMQASWAASRERLRDYFDRTASETWARLTSDAPVSRVRATVRAGRDRMRGNLLDWLGGGNLLDWLGADLSGWRILDAGCGTGALAVEAARRGARVVAVDIAPSLVSVARERTPDDLAARIDWHAGDMLDPALGLFDHVVAMDSLIHYRAPDMVGAVARLAARSRRSVAFTFAPRTPLLSVMHAAGQLFPRSDRSPAIEPVGLGALSTRLSGTEALDGWWQNRDARIESGF